MVLAVTAMISINASKNGITMLFMLRDDNIKKSMNFGMTINPIGYAIKTATAMMTI